MEFDVFISHASEDKQAVARPLADLLRALEVKVWLDENELTLGDSLRRKIDNGLIRSRFGVVILSHSFFSKEWPQKELDGLVAREDGKEKVILPIWHNITVNDVRQYSPLLADRLAAVTSRGLGGIADQIFSAVEKDRANRLNSASIKARAVEISDSPGFPSEGEKIQTSQDSGFYTFDGLIVDALDRIVEVADSQSPNIIGVRTGIVDLDSITLGLQGGQIILAASRPGMGKTSLAAHLAHNVSVNEGLPVIVFSLDIGAHDFTNRVLSAAGNLCTRNMSMGALSDEEWANFPELIESLRSANIFISDSTEDSIDDLITKINRVADTFGGSVGLIIIDGLQQIINQSSSHAMELVNGLLGSLKSVAKQIRCPLVLTSQLNRSVETRPDKRPLLSDLAEMGSLERYADCILFLYRGAYYGVLNSNPNEVEIIVARQKRGPVGTVFTGFNARSGSFYHLKR